MSAGQLLCGGLFSQDGLTAWFAAIALFHAIHQNRALKESLLQVHMAPSSGSGPPVTLMQQCFRLICQVRLAFAINPFNITLRVSPFSYICHLLRLS